MELPMRWQTQSHGHELVLSLVLIVMIVVIGTINPAFFSLG
jgi:hypothetical protein